MFFVTEWSKALSHIDTKYKCWFESHYQLNNINFLFLFNLTEKFNITKVNYYFDIYFLEIDPAIENEQYLEKGFSCGQI